MTGDGAQTSQKGESDRDLFVSPLKKKSEGRKKNPHKNRLVAVLERSSLVAAAEREKI